MVITIQTSRDVIGHNIIVSVASDSSHEIVRVLTRLDGFNLADDFVSPPTTAYNRQFRQAGNFSPGATHTVTVQATDETGLTESASRTWVDT